jgi:putative ABC transport system substrate-binding protein
MRRREFIIFTAGAASWPLVAGAQEARRLPIIGALMSTGETDLEEQPRLAAFVGRLRELGWIEGRNVHLEIRWGAANDDINRRYAAELVAMKADVIVADTSQTVAALQKATDAIPIVAAGFTDPVGAGFVESLARPGGNITGLAGFEYAIAAKWLELLKEIAPDVTRVAVVRDPTIASGIGQFAAIQTVATIGTELSVVAAHDSLDEIERAVVAFARRPNGGLLVTANPFGRIHREVIAALAARHKLPAVYPFRYYATAGGLISYGANIDKLWPPAADYVDRILKGQKPADLPVQQPTKSLSQRCGPLSRTPSRRIGRTALDGFRLRRSLTVG